MSSALSTLLDDADHQWSEGMLGNAYARYTQALEQDPAAWRADFQLAWIDAAFMPLHPSRIRALDRPGLSDEARALLARLGTATRLPDGLARWDLVALRRAPEASQSAWWMRQGQHAAAAGQYGLALACYQEAERLTPDRFHDPPRIVQTLPVQLETHLRVLRNSIAP